MKGKSLIFAACLGFLAFQGTRADDAGDIARAATRRGAVNTSTQSRQKSASATQTGAITDNARSTIQSSKYNSNVRDRTSGTNRTTGVVIRDASRNTTGGNAIVPGVASRTATNVQSRATSNNVIPAQSRAAVSVPRSGATRTATNVAAPARSATTISRSAASATRGAIDAASSARSATSASRIARSATDTNTATTLTVSDIVGKDYKKCREVYYNCMDEFCANKDSQLKRCACSSRVNEFDKTKKQLSNVEDKLLDFNQRLLTVNMDKEDAEALFKATEGEIAFNQEDKTQSKKILDEIAKKLNTSFDDSNFDRNLSAISLSLNTDAAFDTVDSLQGASTTTKTGVSLYNAALPVCLEMAREVCTEDELAIAESGYQMTIEQDCNTVAKSYSTQTDQAREKIREGSALLDMSRLDIYQKRNADDILTCKKKMLEMLSDTTVCGENLGKCLDTSGRYIDPSTGEAFLTVDLANLGNLITRPDANQTWTNAPGNQVFVSFLNSKKKFLEPAMENCQDIADYVWDEFIEDALAQIKLAQESKLEDMRQSCTTLTTQCLSDTADSLEDFDARALSTFGVAADKTVNAMCAEVRNACTALLETTGGDQDWVGGMTEIATDKTYDTIMQTCREVGRACIIQACKSISGNFGLCESIQTSVNRKSIINRTACWGEVQECVASAGDAAIAQIFKQLSNSDKITDNSFYYDKFYGELYGAGATITNDEDEKSSCSTKDKGTVNCVYDICQDECTTNADSNDCKICRISEKIWGNCEVIPSRNLEQTGSHNKIKIPINSKTETLLSWFAKNTGTDNMDDSCRDTSCGIGFQAQYDPNKQATICVSKENMTSDNIYCPAPPNMQISITEGTTNCCESSDGKTVVETDRFGNCCKNTLTSISGLNFNATNSYYKWPYTSSTAKLCMPSNNMVFTVAVNMPTDDKYYNSGMHYLVCDGTLENKDDENVPEYPGGQTIKCTGKYVFVSKSGKYITPKYATGNTSATAFPDNFYKIHSTETGDTKCTWNQSDKQWTPDVSGNTCPVQGTSIKHWQINY